MIRILAIALFALALIGCKREVNGFDTGKVIDPTEQTGTFITVNAEEDAANAKYIADMKMKQVENQKQEIDAITTTPVKILELGATDTYYFRHRGNDCYLVMTNGTIRPAITCTR